MKPNPRVHMNSVDCCIKALAVIRTRRDIHSMKRCCIDVSEEHCDPNDALLCMDKILACTGMCLSYPTPGRRGWLALKVLWTIMLLASSSYLSLYEPVHSEVSGKTAFSVTVFIISWRVQDLFTMTVFLYFQAKGRLTAIRVTLSRLTDKCSQRERALLKRSISRFVAFTLLVILAIGLLNVADVVVMYTREHEANSTASWVEYSIRHAEDASNATAAGSNAGLLAHLPVLMSVLAQITTSIGLVVACYFNCCCVTLAHTVYAFLHRVRGINGGGETRTNMSSGNSLYEARDADRERRNIVLELKECRDHYGTIVEAVQLVNDVFEVFLAVMMLLKIPSSMFMLLKCFLGTKASLLDFAFNLSELLFSIVDLLSVSVMPARVHSLLRQIDSALMGNMNIWLPPNKSVYEHGALLIGQIRQPDLGLSLLGFAVITKPLILRVTVAILTYLIIFVQLYPSWSTVFDDVDWYS